MQATTSRPNARANMRGRGGPRPSFKGIGRAVRYLMNYKRQAVLPYIFLVIATLAQLAVPRMIRNIIDAVMSGVAANAFLSGIKESQQPIPNQAIPKIAEAASKAIPGFTFPANGTLDQFKAQLETTINNAPQLLINALIFIIIFAVLRGLFAFL